jgi:hypothetical protein
LRYPIPLASHYPHEVDVVAAKQMIDETVVRSDISLVEKQGLLGENAIQFAATAMRIYELAKADGRGRDIPRDWFMTDRGEGFYSP